MFLNRGTCLNGGACTFSHERAVETPVLTATLSNSTAVGDDNDSPTFRLPHGTQLLESTSGSRNPPSFLEKSLPGNHRLAAVGSWRKGEDVSVSTSSQRRW